MSTTDPRQTTLQLATGYWASRCLHVIAEIAVADHIDDGVASPEALAEAVGAHSQSLARVLRALAAHGVFEEVAGAFATRPPRGCCAPTIRNPFGRSCG